MSIVLVCAVLVVFVVSIMWAKQRFTQKRDGIKHRIHISGEGGRTIVARYTAAILRDAGVRTFGKTTGAAGRVILPDGQDAVVSRHGYPRLAAQLRMVRSFASRRAEAMVIESASSKPGYRQWLEGKALNSQIVVITNLRIGRRDIVSSRLTGAVRRLTRSLPPNAIVVTAEQRPGVLAALRAECKRKTATLIQAPVQQVKRSHMTQFGRSARKENVAVGLAIAKLFKIPSRQAMLSMAATPTGKRMFSQQSPVTYKPGLRLRSGLNKVLVNIDAGNQA